LLFSPCFPIETKFKKIKHPILWLGNDMHYSERFTHISSLNRKRGTPVKFSAFEIHVTDEETETQRIHPATVAYQGFSPGKSGLVGPHG
jgi:hypothetical protein